MLTTAKLGKRLTYVIIAGLLAIATFYVVNGYLTSKNQLESSVLQRLQAIANTTAIQIDGDSH